MGEDYPSNLTLLDIQRSSTKTNLALLTRTGNSRYLVPKALKINQQPPRCLRYAYGTNYRCFLIYSAFRLANHRLGFSHQGSVISHHSNQMAASRCYWFTKPLPIRFRTEMQVLTDDMTALN
jgi:hypothetical protein